jgi:uncharacterized protein
MFYDYEWDSEKALANLHKHGIDFADAAIALEDEQALTIEDDYSDERRFITIGADGLGRLLTVVYTYRSAIIRIISARKATSQERQNYLER